MPETAIPPREIRARRIAFEPEHIHRRHFVGGDLVMSHVVATLSALFPEGEDFFVESVRRHRRQVTDTELTRQVSGFIGQEAMHSREHAALNAHLADLGYLTGPVDATARVILGLVGRLPASWQLAVTAALEHYTATLAEVLLENEEARERLADEEIRNLLLWHAFEESEHKSVAFDVYATVVGNERLRVQIMNLTTVIFLFVAVGWTAIGVTLDPTTWRHPGRLLASLRQIPNSPWLTRTVRRRIRDYNRRGFHPDDFDATALLDEWRPRLFGDGGTLAARVENARA